jgi:hypothetical protein
MFGSDQSTADYRFFAPGQYSDGSEEDLLDASAGGPLDQRGFWFDRWWKLLDGAIAQGSPVPQWWLQWECRVHNEGALPPARRLNAVSFKMEVQDIPPIGQPWPPVKRFTIATVYCGALQAAPAG